MNRIGIVGAAVGAAALGLASAASAATDSDDAMRQIEELRRQNQELASKVAKLEQVATDDGVWLTEARATEIRDLVNDVLADADTRASLQGAGATAGWDKGFFLASPDGNFRLNIKGQIQFRWAASYRDVPNTLATRSGSGNEKNWGFENRRTKITFAGHVVDPSLTYEVKMAFNRKQPAIRSSGLGGGSVTLSNGDVTGLAEDVWIQKAFDGGFAVRAGQFKAPYLREELVSSTSQLAVERSLVADFFTAKYAQGVQLDWANEFLRIQGFYGDGMRANGVNPTSSSGAASGYAGSYQTDYITNETDWAFAGRAEFLAAGGWKQFSDLSSFRGEEFGLLLGVAAMAQNFRPSTTNGSAESLWGITGDVAVDFGGANLFAYAVMRNVNFDSPVATRAGGTADDATQWGFVVQGGFFVTDDIELFGRYEYGDADMDQFRTEATSTSAGLSKASVATAGVNVFPMGSKNKALKWATDVGYAFDAVGDFNSSGGDWLLDATASGGGSSDGQVVIRSQIQLVF